MEILEIIFEYRRMALGYFVIDGKIVDVALLYDSIQLTPINWDPKRENKRPEGSKEKLKGDISETFGVDGVITIRPIERTTDLKGYFGGYDKYFPLKN